MTKKENSDAEGYENNEESEEESELEEALEDEKSEDANEDAEPETELNIEEIDDIKNLDFSRFTQRMQTLDMKAPVLEEITEEQEGPRFIRTGGTTPVGSQSGEDSDEFTYIPSNTQNEENETRYVPSEQISASPQRINPMKERINVTGFNAPSPETFFTQSREASFGGGWTAEKIRTQPERVDPRKAGREDPFQQEERKYEKYEPDRPSARP